MANLSDTIELFIKALFEDAGDYIEIQRNELADQFKCVPSQINYVISTRFTNQMGYYVESRRGGGGHIKIKRMNFNKPVEYLMHIAVSLGDSITYASAEAFINNFVDYGAITEREARAMKAALSERAIIDVPVEIRDIVRARILKNILTGILL